MGKLEKINEVRHTMVQIAGLLAEATVFIGIWTLIFIFYNQGGGSLYVRQTTYAGTS